MGFKHFRLGVILRLLLFSALLGLVFALYRESRYSFSLVILLLLAAGIAINLIWYVEKTNRKITHFLESIRHSDFSTSFSDHHLGAGFKELNEAFNQVIREFQRTRAEKEEHYNFLQTVVQHVHTGLLTFREDGKVHLYNNAFKRMLRIHSLLSVEDLELISPELPRIILGMRAGDRELVKVHLENEMLQILLYAAEFRLRNENYTLVGLQNIHSELEEKEIESWQNLIRVLTHEIMNSMTPISSLASTVKAMLVDEDSGEFQELDEEDRQSIQGALDTIQARSHSLLHFVEAYRNLTRIPRPNFRHFQVRELLERNRQLLQPKLDTKGIQVNHRVMPERLMVTADPDLLDQVVINLLLNAIDAVKDKEDPLIEIRARANENDKILIEIKDNGQGIAPDMMDKIFMPFFTSKKHGSGIGLSLSRQIMHLHKGSISVRSVPGEGSIFTLTF
jgi:nitrogen fixation/metabolism regulation signal transduction histidine kinase